MGVLGMVAMQGWAHPVQAQEVEELESYSVSASRVALPMGAVGSSVTLLTEDDLNRFMGPMGIDAVRHVPGVFLRNSGGMGAVPGITMRGLPVAPMVMIDGIEVNNPGNGDVFNFGNLPMSQIESIEVLRGAQSALYGANALTGVISITTRKGEDLGYMGRAGASYGSHQTMHGYVTMSDATERYNVFVNAAYYDAGGFSSQNPAWGAEWADDDLYRNQSLMGKSEIVLSDYADLILIGNYVKSKSEYDPGIPDPWTVAQRENVSTSEQGMLKSELRLRPMEGVESSLAVGYHQVENRAIDSFGDRRDESRLLKLDWINEVRLSDAWRVVAGLEWKKSEDRLGDYSMETSSVFVENIVAPVESLHLTVAGRYDDSSAYGSETTWRGSFSYELSDTGFRVKGSYGIAFDAPEIAQLFGTWGNPDLVPEEGRSYDVGFEHSLMDGCLTWGVTWFDVLMEDRIEFMRSTYSYANVDWASQGVESFVQWNCMDDMSVRVAYSHADAERKKVDDDRLFHSPENQLSLLVDKSFLSEALHVAVSALHVGDRETWSGPTDSYVTVDVAARYRIMEGLDVWGRVQNLFDETYEEVYGYCTGGLGFFGGVDIEF